MALSNEATAFATFVGTFVGHLATDEGIEETEFNASLNFIGHVNPKMAIYLGNVVEATDGQFYLPQGTDAHAVADKVVDILVQA